MLRVRGRRVVVVGCGTVAARRVAALIHSGAEVTVIAPQLDPSLESLDGNATVHRRAYQTGDLTGAFLVVAATNDVVVNEAVCSDARSVGALVNRADLPDEGDVVIPAHEHRGPITVAVTTGGVSARAAAVIRDHLLLHLDGDWERLLTRVEPYRQRVKDATADAERRRKALHMLTDPEAMRVLKEEGEGALAARCESAVEWAGLDSERF